MQMNPYLYYDGNCEEALKFYEKVLDAKILAMMTHENTPLAKNTPPGWQKKILHARMTIGDQVLMASDSPPEHYRKQSGFSLGLGFSDPAEAERIYRALAEGGTETMPIAETFWALKFGMLVDRFGIPWMINCEKAAEQAA
jgi:PhnB protein